MPSQPEKVQTSLYQQRDPLPFWEQELHETCRNHRIQYASSVA